MATRNDINDKIFSIISGFYGRHNKANGKPPDEVASALKKAADEIIDFAFKSAPEIKPLPKGDVWWRLKPPKGDGWRQLKLFEGWNGENRASSSPTY